MNTKLLLTASALVMGFAGILGSFAPVEIAAALDLEPRSALPVIVQIAAALLFAFAMVNWMARGSLIGGIYNRPVAVGNVTHFVVGALALAKAVAAGERRPPFIVATIIYIVFAGAFATVLFKSPVEHRPET